MRKISSNFIDERRQKIGLCCHCDEKWNPTHNCRDSRVYLIHGDEDLIDSKEIQQEKPKLPIGEEEGLTGTTTRELEISLTAISGTPTSDTMRLLGRIGNVGVVILVDSGSTHKFFRPLRKNEPVYQLPKENLY